MKNEKPVHIGFIMDGNRRWARQQGLAIFKGHEIGVDSFEKILDICLHAGIKHATFYAFSTENWNRDKKEIAELMKLFKKMTKDLLKKCMDENARFSVLGEIDRFDEELQMILTDTTEKTKNNTGMKVNMALNYGGRSEIVRAASQCVEKGVDITEENIKKNLYTNGQPYPDFIIRTGGEMRLSNFLTWQSAYSELYFTDIFWPDFDAKELEKALSEYARRQRRFGK